MITMNRLYLKCSLPCNLFLSFSFVLFCFPCYYYFFSFSLIKRSVFIVRSTSSNQNEWKSSIKVTRSNAQHFDVVPRHSTRWFLTARPGDPGGPALPPPPYQGRERIINRMWILTDKAVCLSLKENFVVSQIECLASLRMFACWQ